MIALTRPVVIWQGDIPMPNAPFKQSNVFLSRYRESILSMRESPQERESTNIIVFIGGLMDSYHRVVFREFAQFRQGTYPKLAHIPFGAKIYTTFDHKALFSSWLPLLIDSGYRPYIFAHSWGAANICKVLSRLVLVPRAIPLLVTMDPVGYWHLAQKPSSVELWVNLYVADKWRHITSPNICTYIGHAWNHCASADIEIMLKNHHSHTKSDKNCKIIAHASIRTMIESFNTHKDISL